jgi:predicted nuclease with TOPRIM domain
VKKYLGSPVDVDVDRLKTEFEKLKDENIKLKREVQELKAQVGSSHHLFFSSLKSNKTSNEQECITNTKRFNITNP